MKLKFLILILIIAFFSCNNPVEQNTNKYDFVKKNKICFHVDESINPYAINIQYVQFKPDDKRLYLLCNNNQLLIYNFSNRKLIKKIKLEKEGNNGVGKANGFKVINKDSIFITSRFYQALFLINSNGKIIDKFSYKCDSLYTSGSAANLEHNIYIIGNEIVVPQNLEGNWNHISKEYFNNYSTTINLNYKTNRIEQSGMKLPFQYPNVASPSFSFIKLDESFLYSFISLDSLYLLDENRKTKAFFAKTNNIKKLVNKKKGNVSNIETIIRDKAKRGEYGNLFYDTGRKIIYRFYKIGKENITSNDILTDLHAYPPTFGIQIFDLNIKKLADIVFPEKTYFFHNSFVAQDGLYISVNHPENTDFDVNYFCFDRFEIIKQ